MLPDSMNLIRLKHLDLEGCSNLILTGQTLENVSTLEMLDFSECCKMEILPSQVTRQQFLKELRLEYTNLKELPNDIGDLSNLEILEISSPSLETLPHSLGKLKQLTLLSIIDAPIREVTFASVEKVQGGRRLLDSCIDKCMPRLKWLHLWRTRITEISFGEGVCPVLEELHLHSCYELVEVGGLPTTLTSLNLEGCRALKKLSGLRGLAKLESLDMKGCIEIEDLPALGGLEFDNLRALNLQECAIGGVLPFASVENVGGDCRLLDSSIDKCMLRLKSLNLSKTRITEISFGEGVCPALVNLSLQDCAKLVEVGALPTTLTSLYLNHCCALKKLRGLRGLAKLRSLNMDGCIQIEDPRDLDVRELDNLTNLNLSACAIGGALPFDKCKLRLSSLKLSKTKITEISFGEGVCPALEDLILDDCAELVEVGALPTTLTDLSLKRCCALKKLRGLSGLAKLRDLNMEGCIEIEDLPALGVLELDNLRDLNLNECAIGGVLAFDKCMLQLSSLKLSKTKITEISFGEGVCPALRSLHLEDCAELVEVGALPTTLTYLSLEHCCALKKLRGLRGLAKLEHLNMEGCIEIEDLPALGVLELDNLTFLNLSECAIGGVLPFASVENVGGDCRLLDSSIDKCMLRLQHLDLSKTRITEISFGEGVCPALEHLYLQDCAELVEVGALPTTLRNLSLEHCCALKKSRGLRGLAKLFWLNMIGCCAVEELPGLETLISLSMMWTSKCENMERILELAEAANPESNVFKKVQRYQC